MAADDTHALVEQIRALSRQMDYWRARVRAGDVTPLEAQKEINDCERRMDEAAFKLGQLRERQRRKVGL